MSRTRHVRWTRWVAAIVGLLVGIKSAVFLIRRILRIAGGEMQARGSDEAFLMNLAARRRSG